MLKIVTENYLHPFNFLRGGLNLSCQLIRDKTLHFSLLNRVLINYHNKDPGDFVGTEHRDIY